MSSQHKMNSSDKHRQDMAAQRLSEYMARTGRRNTPERRALLDVIATLAPSFSIEDAMAAMEDIGMHVSQATVYNNMDIFVAAGIVGRFYGANGAQYQLLPANKHNLVCITCGKIKNIKDQSFSEVLRARRYSAFTASYYQMTVYGICSTCARKSKKTNIKSLNNKK